MITFNQVLLFSGVILIALLVAGSHLCIKKGASAQNKHKSCRLNKWFWTLTGIFLNVAAFLCQILILRHLPLIVVYPIGSLVYILVPLGALYLLKERLKPRFWVGACAIIVGVCVIGLTQGM
jgi:drug/metabolite transporter (DMT)-like permease